MAQTSENLLQRLRRDPVPLLWLLFAVWSLAVFIVPLRFGPTTDVSVFDRDFVNYWVGARLAVAGDELMLFYHNAYFGLLQSLFGPDYPLHSWSYPPHYLLMLWPLGHLGYWTALACFLAVTFALFGVCVRAFRARFAPEVGGGVLALALVAYVAMMISATQNGFLVASLMLVALACLRSRPWLAGLALACLTVKPQLGLLLGLVVLLDREWRVLAWTLAFGAALVGLSLLLFGLDCWQAYFEEVVAYQKFVMEHWYGGFHRMMPGTFGSLRALGLTPGIAFAAHMVVALAALPAIVWLVVKLRDPLQRAFVLLAGTFVLTPYAFNYDMGALCVVAALLARTEAVRRAPLAAVAIGAIVVLPGVMYYLGSAHLPISPLLLLAALAAVGVVGLRGAAAPAAPGTPPATS